MERHAVRKAGPGAHCMTWRGMQCARPLTCVVHVRPDGSPLAFGSWAGQVRCRRAGPRRAYERASMRHPLCPCLQSTVHTQHTRCTQPELPLWCGAAVVAPAPARPCMYASCRRSSAPSRPPSSGGPRAPSWVSCRLGGEGRAGRPGGGSGRARAARRVWCCGPRGGWDGGGAAANALAALTHVSHRHFC